MADETPGTLKEREPHPAAFKAMEYIRSLGALELMQMRESFASTAISGNRLGEVCGETLERLMTGQPVSDRYLLGLAWSVRSILEPEPVT